MTQSTVKILFRRMAIFSLLFALAGCTALQREIGPTEAELVRKSFLPRVERPALAPRYCYRTLAAVDCHAKALPKEASRRQGSYHPLRADEPPEGSN